MITIAINENRIASTLGRVFCGDANTQIVIEGVEAEGLRVALIDPARKVLALCNEFEPTETNAVGTIALNTQELANALRDIPTGRVQRVAFVVYNASGTLGSGFMPIVAEPLPSEITPIPPSESYLTASALAEALEAVSAPTGEEATQANIRNALNALIEALKGIGVAVALFSGTLLAEPMRWDSVPPSTPVNTNNLTANFSQYIKPNTLISEPLIFSNLNGLGGGDGYASFYWDERNYEWTADHLAAYFGFNMYSPPYAMTFRYYNANTGQEETVTLEEYVASPWTYSPAANTNFVSISTAEVRFTPTVLTIDIPRGATLLANTNDWRDGLAVLARMRAHGSYDVADNIKVLGYGAFPTNNATAVFFRDGNVIFCNVLNEY